MKSDILIYRVIFCTTLFAAVKSQAPLNRQKRIDTSVSARSNHLRSPFNPPDEHGNTERNYAENHLLDSNVKPRVLIKSPYLPPDESELQDSRKILNRIPTTAKIPSIPKRHAKKTHQNYPKPKPKPTPQVAFHSPQKHPSTTDDDKKGSPFQPIEAEEFRLVDDVERSRPFGRERDVQETPVYRQTGKGNKKSVSALESIMERQRQNTKEIPSISQIQVVPRQARNRQYQQPQQQQQQYHQEQPKQSAHAIRVKANRARPRHTSYQNRVQNAPRDMHDAGPGVTPWTRYTSRPRNTGRRKNRYSSSYRGRCGSKQYSPRNQICCQGNVLRRQGIQPSCCRSQTYDAVYKKCCQGEIVTLTAKRPGC